MRALQSDCVHIFVHLSVHSSVHGENIHDMLFFTVGVQNLCVHLYVWVLIHVVGVGLLPFKCTKKQLDTAVTGG